MKPYKQVEHSLHDLSSLKRGFTFWGMVVTLLVAAFFAWQQHGNWLSHPNQLMLGGGHDCFKNYMAAAWHVKHDSSYVHFGGMNYPYGEHVLFTDNQPIISAGMQWWNKNIHDISGNVVGILNTIQVVSLLFGCCITFLLLRKLHLPLAYAGVGAIALTFLAPQYLRFGDHFGLSHTFVIPLILYWLCRYEERSSRRYQSLHIGFLVWFAAQLHFYYFGMAALFITLYLGFQVLRDFTWHNIRKRMSHWIVMLIIPFVLLNIWIHWANYATDRASYPYGFTSYIGYWEGVFLPYDFMPLHQWISNHIVKIRTLEFESKAYAGGLALVYTLWLIFSGFKMFGKGWEEAAYHRVHKHYLRGIFFAAFLLLLFACGFPFAIKGLEWLVDYMGPLRQFRGLGRFTWVYYYVINTLILYGAWNWGRRFTGFGEGKKFPQFKYIIWGLPLVILSYEAVIMQTNKSGSVPNYADRTTAAEGPDRWLKKVDFTQFQAILPLPYYHIGSENIWKEFDPTHYHRVTETAYHTGLPDMGVNMSRTPIGEMVKSMQLVLEPGEVPAILSDLPDKRPIAILARGAAWDQVVRQYKHLVSKADIIYEDGDVKILRLELDALRAYTREFRAAVENELANRTPLYEVPEKNWMATTPDPLIFEMPYEDQTASKFYFQGKGALTGTMSDTTVIWRGKLPKGPYTFSIWLKVNQDMGANHDLHVTENALSDGHLVHHQHEGLRFHIKSIVNGWGLFEIGFDNREEGDIRIFLHKKGVNLPFYADQALVKPLNTEVYRKTPGWVVRNNFWYRTE